MSNLCLLAADCRQALFDAVKVDEGASVATRHEIGRAIGLIDRMSFAIHCDELRVALAEIAHLRPAGDVEQCKNARALVKRMEQIAGASLATRSPDPARVGGE